jgi:hypothetical protein
MGIDRIGPNRPPVAPSSAPAASSPAGATRPFQVQGTNETAPAAPVAASNGAALERLRAGEIDLDGYLDLKVQEATGHLGALSPAQLESIRGALRDRISADPALVDLVRAATGRAPEPPHDD